MQVPPSRLSGSVNVIQRRVAGSFALLPEAIQREGAVQLNDRTVNRFSVEES